MLTKFRCLYASIVFSSLASRAVSFTFWFTSHPTQCANMTVQWTGGKPPYTLLLVPVGHVDPETRLIQQHDVPSGNSISFVLNYPAQSQFVAVMNDATGIGAGGTSVVQTVVDSSSNACLNRNLVQPKFYFYLSPSDIGQCDAMNISWEANAEDPVDLLGLIPGGQSFEIANVTDGDTDIEWQADIRAGTQILLVAGDEDGLGSGGSTDIMDVGDGDSNCIGDSSPSSTSGPPAGGVSSSSTNPGGSNPTGTTNVGGGGTTGTGATGTNGGGTGATGTSATGTNGGGTGATGTNGGGTGATGTNGGGTGATGTNGGSTGTGATGTDGGGSNPTGTDSGSNPTGTGSTDTGATGPSGTDSGGNGGSTGTPSDQSGDGGSLPSQTGGSGPPSSSSLPGSGHNVTGPQGASSNGDNHLGMILGIVFGVLALIALLGGAYYLYRRHRRRIRSDPNDWTFERDLLIGTARPWSSASHIRGGTESYSTLPSMYQAEPFILPPREIRRPEMAARHSHTHSVSSLSQDISHYYDHTSTAIAGLYDPATTRPAIAPTMTERKAGAGTHGEPPLRRSPSGRVLPPLVTNGMPPPSIYQRPTKITRDSEDTSPEPEITSPVSLHDDDYVEIPPTYHSIRSSSERRHASLQSLFSPTSPTSLTSASHDHDTR